MTKQSLVMIFIYYNTRCFKIVYHETGKLNITNVNEHSLHISMSRQSHVHKLKMPPLETQ